MQRTRTASVTVTDEFTIARIDRDVRQTTADADENLSATIAAGAGKRRPLLLDLSVCAPIGNDVRERYSNPDLLDHFFAIAIVIEASAVGRMMGNVYLRVARPRIPMRLFTDEASAGAWLRAVMQRATPVP